MTETNAQKQAGALLDAAQHLIGDLPRGQYGRMRADDVLPVRELVNMAMLLLNAGDPAKEAKRARDRERRAEAKAKARPKKLKPKSRVTWTGPGEAHTE